MGVAPLAAGSLALLDDGVDRLPRRVEVGDGDELRPPEVLFGRLGVRGPDKEALRAKPLGQVFQACLDGPVELADGVELLQLRDDLVRPVSGQRDGPRDRLETLGILDVHPVRPLEECEVAEGGLAERHQLDSDSGRVRVGGHREVRPGEARGGADRRQQVLDEREVEHLLLADLQEGLAPALGGGERLGREPLLDLLLEREGREQVLEHHEVLELGRLAERVDQCLPVLEAPGVRIIRPPADVQDAGERTVRAGGHVLVHWGASLAVRDPVDGLRVISRAGSHRGALVDRRAGLVQAVVRIAPPPVLTGLGGPDHRMPRLAEVGRGVPARAQVAAARAPAGEALAEMDPAAADLDAR